jgi:hypothetical protein
MKLEEAVARSPVSGAMRDDAKTGLWLFRKGRAFYLYRRRREGRGGELFREVAPEQLALHDDWRPMRSEDLAPEDRPKRPHSDDPARRNGKPSREQ